MIVRVLRSRLVLTVLTLLLMACIVTLHIAMEPVRARGNADKVVRHVIEVYNRVSEEAREAPVPLYLGGVTERWKNTVLPVEFRRIASPKIIAKADSSRVAAGREIERKASAWIQEDLSQASDNLDPRDVAVLLPAFAGLPGLQRSHSPQATDEVVEQLIDRVLAEVRLLAHPGTDAARLSYARDLLKLIQTAVPRSRAPEYDMLWRSIAERLEVVSGKSPTQAYVAERRIERVFYVRRMQEQFSSAGVAARFQLTGDDFAVLEVAAEREEDRASIRQILSRKQMLEVLRDLGFRALSTEGVDHPLFGNAS